MVTKFILRVYLNVLNIPGVVQCLFTVFASPTNIICPLLATPTPLCQLLKDNHLPCLSETFTVHSIMCGDTLHFGILQFIWPFLSGSHWTSNWSIKDLKDALFPLVQKTYISSSIRFVIFILFVMSGQCLNSLFGMWMFIYPSAINSDYYSILTTFSWYLCWKWIENKNLILFVILSSILYLTSAVMCYVLKLGSKKSSILFLIIFKFAFGILSPLHL